MATVVRIHEPGGPEALRVDEVDPGQPGEGQVRVRQTAVGVNFIDTYHRSGLYPLPSMPHGIGMAAAGVVEAVGPGVSGLNVGDRVCYGTGTPGSYASERVMSAAPLLKMPDGIDDEAAATMMLRGMTVQYLIRKLFRVEKGMTVLFHAAAGGLGLIACQWLNHLGVTVIGTVGSDEKAEVAKAHGCHHTVNYSKEDFVARVKEITNGKGVPVVYDGVGKTVFDKSLDCLSQRGLMVNFGNASGPAPAIDPLLLSRKGSLFLTRPTLAHYTGTRPELEETANDLFDVVKKGIVKIDIGGRYALKDAAQCHRDLEGRKIVGSPVLIP